MKIRRVQVGEITLYRVASTFYVGIHPDEPYRRAGLCFTIVVPPRRGAAPPLDTWRSERWRTVAVARPDGQTAVEMRLLETTPLTDEQITFFERLR